MEKDKKTILQEAILDYDEIVKNANAVAMKKTAEEFPEKFNSILKEELKKNTKKSDIKKDEKKEQESLVNEEKNEQPEMKETKKEKINESGAFAPDADYFHPTNEAEDGDGLTIDEIENEINKMEELSDDIPNDGDDFDLSELDSYSEDNLPLDSEDELPLDDEFDYDSFESEFDSQFGDEPNKSLMEDEFDLNLDEFDDLDDMPDVEEGLGITHARRKGVDAGLNPEHYPQRRRYTYQESVKAEKLMEQNKKLTKSLNENRSKNSELTKLVDEYKNAISKYRTQLKEMAVFNTNLSHVNNLLVNENLSLTKEDKVKIIKEFKNVDNIETSEQKYKTMLKEMSEHKKKSIDETLTDKISNPITPSAKNKLDEVVEKNAYSDNEHIEKIKRMINYVERRKK